MRKVSRSSVRVPYHIDQPITSSQRKLLSLSLSLFDFFLTPPFSSLKVCPWFEEQIARCPQGNIKPQQMKTKYLLDVPLTRP